MKNKNDRRSLRTRHLLGDALVTLIREKDYSTITVSDIIERANVGRSTFYSHYQDKDALLVSQLERVIQVLSQHVPSPKELPYFPTLGLFRHVGEQYELYKILVWTPGIDVLIKQMRLQKADGTMMFLYLSWRTLSLAVFLHCSSGGWRINESRRPSKWTTFSDN